jgi:hypothetical protein
MKRINKSSCLEAIGEIIVEIVIFGIGAAVLLMLGIDIDHEALDGDLISLIGVGVAIVIGVLIFCVVRIVQKARAKNKNEINQTEALTDTDENTNKSKGEEDVQDRN